MTYDFLIRENFKIIEVSDDENIFVDETGRPVDLKFRAEKWDEMVDKLNYLREEVKKIPGTKRVSTTLEQIALLFGKIQDERLSYNQKNDLERQFHLQSIKLHDSFNKMKDKLESIESEIYDFIFLFIFFVTSFYGIEKEFMQFQENKHNIIN